MKIWWICFRKLGQVVHLGDVIRKRKSPFVSSTLGLKGTIFSTWSHKHGRRKWQATPCRNWRQNCVGLEIVSWGGIKKRLETFLLMQKRLRPELAMHNVNEMMIPLIPSWEDWLRRQGEQRLKRKRRKKVCFSKSLEHYGSSRATRTQSFFTQLWKWDRKETTLQLWCLMESGILKRKTLKPT